MKSKRKNNSWKETKDVMKSFPDLLKYAKQIEKDIKSGKYKQYISLEEIIKREECSHKKNKSDDMFKIC